MEEDREDRSGEDCLDLRQVGDAKNRLITRILKNLSIELRELDFGQNNVTRVPDLTPNELLRDYVASNKPVVLTSSSAVANWPCLTHRKWTKDYLLKQVGHKKVTVAMTPNGRADCPTPDPANRDGTTFFALPHQDKQHTLAEFFQLLEDSENGTNPIVPYLQYQNSSLTEELPELLEDIDEGLTSLSQTVFGCSSPEAINIWIGGRKSITSWHKDHYENLYCMVSGSKTFRLLPPSDVYRMRLRRYRTAVWHLDDEQQFTLRPINNDDDNNDDIDRDNTTVLWSSIVPRLGPGNNSAADDGSLLLQGDAETRGGFSDDDDDIGPPDPLIVTLKQGEILYLPSCWYHEVHHGERGSVAIAVNFWFDMRFDAKYAHMKAIEAFAVLTGLNDA